ncbi:PigN-domain-containing protein [Phellopilus nigrolimitatus]|nr:PigN-domain-containing protein [Phellopilus nigrolimitatus]
MVFSRMGTSMTSTLLLGLVIHLVYILAVFDCYFTSPVVHGMQHFSIGDAEAKRLVLFVADGLRADLLYNLNPFPAVPNSPEIIAPYLRDIVQTQGAYGVSHTRVPTESRPGHVALIGGMYEDVSAVTRVNFDSVFNQSRYTFSFGSPDILPMFSRGAVPGRVKTWMYDEEDEDFTRDATELDVWVLNQLKHMRYLTINLRGDKVVFFLHLLGLDTTGHSYRPHSKEYMRNIQVVDSIVAHTERLFDDFFGDNETSFIFTADHGMSNIGNHGDGNPDSTRTPLVAWGAGVRGPLPDTTPSTHDVYSSSWGLSHLLRRDVEQADIAPLMSTLLGLNFPANSVGVLPDVDVGRAGYLALRDGERGKARAAVANAKSILEHYRVKHRLKSSHKVFYKPFPGLATQSVAGLPGSGHLLKIDQLVYSQMWEAVCSEAGELIKLSLEGLRYLETYSFLLPVISCGYIGWSAFSTTALLLKSSSPPSGTWRGTAINTSALIILLALYALFAVQREPWTYYLYVTFPCYFWWSIVSRLSELRIFEWRLRMPFAHDSTFVDGNPQKKLTTSFHLFLSKPVRVVAMAVFSLQAMVHAYRHRSLWSVGFVVIGVFWPLLSWPKSVQKSQPALRLKWATACLVCGVFPLRNVEQSEDLRVIAAGGMALGLAGWYSLKVTKHRTSRRKNIMQLGLTALSILVTADSVRRLSAKEGLPVFNQVLGWVILLSSTILPTLFPFRALPRSAKLLTLFLAFASTFVLLAICAEGLFYLSYCATLVVWVDAEAAVRRAVDQERPLTYKEKAAKGKLNSTQEREEHSKKSTAMEYTPRADDVRIALFFLFFVQVAFFGTGKSFYLEPVYRLVPIFSPFIMGALLIFKIIAPYVMLSAAFATLSTALHVPPFALFLIALSLTDGMTITFFVRVVDTGSWLEIGQSISFFVISSLLLVWSAGICALGEWLMCPVKTR